MTGARRVLLIEPLLERRRELSQALTGSGLTVVPTDDINAALKVSSTSVFDIAVIGSGVGLEPDVACSKLRASRDAEQLFLVVVCDAARLEDVGALASDDGPDDFIDVPDGAPLDAKRLAARLAIVERRIVEREASERAYRAGGGSMNGFTDVLENVPDVILMVDPEGMIVFNNRGGPGMTSIAASGRSLFDFSLPEHRAHLRATFEEALATGQSQSYELERYGRWFAVRLFPMRLGTDKARVIIISTDITQRKQMEEALSVSEARAKAVLDALPDLVFRLNRDGVFLDYRAEDVEELYAAGDRIIGASVRDLMPPDIAELSMKNIAEALDTGAMQVFEYTIQLGPKGTKHYEARVVVTGPDEVLAIVRDVTQHRQTEAQLRAADRMASLGTLAAGVAHEINNPLAYMLLNMRFVGKELGALGEAGGALGERAAGMKARLDDALEGAERVRRIVCELKTFARGDDEAVGPVDVHGPLEAAINIAANEIRHRARIARCFGDVPFVQGNDKHLGQVFLNLLINAAQAIEEGDAERNEIRVATSREEDGRVVVEITDTGSGIAPDVMEHIFDPFFTTKQAGVGTGLGLWICQRIVSGLGGSIEVRSAVGKGSTFAIKLPTAYAKEAHAAS